MDKSNCLIIDESKLINQTLHNVHNNISLSFQPTYFMPNFYTQLLDQQYFCGPLIMMIKEFSKIHDIS